MSFKSKLQAKKDHQYNQDYLLVASLAYHWKKLKPESDELQALCMTIADIHTYVQSLQADLRIYREMEQEDENQQPENK